MYYDSIEPIIEIRYKNLEAKRRFVQNSNLVKADGTPNASEILNIVRRDASLVRSILPGKDVELVAVSLQDYLTQKDYDRIFVELVIILYSGSRQPPYSFLCLAAHDAVYRSYCKMLITDLLQAKGTAG